MQVFCVSFCFFIILNKTITNVFSKDDKLIRLKGPERNRNSRINDSDGKEKTTELEVKVKESLIYVFFKIKSQVFFHSEEVTG